MQRLREQTFQLGDRALNCAVGPENGPPVVLFHGVTRCWRDFQPLFPGLIERFQVFAPDHRGHGRSDRGGDYRVPSFAADAVAFLDLLDARGSGPAVLIGHSLGALVAAVVAAGRPGRVRALILEDPPGTAVTLRISQSRFRLQFANTERLLADGAGAGGSPGARDAEALARDLAVMPVQRPADGAVIPFGEIRDMNALRFSAECLLQMDPAVLSVFNAGRWLEDLDWFGLLPRIECPTLVLRADPACGGMLDKFEAERICSLIPHCGRVEFPGIGHSIHSGDPDRMLAQVTHFLSGIGLFPKGVHP